MDPGRVLVTEAEIVQIKNRKRTLREANLSDEGSARDHNRGLDCGVAKCSLAEHGAHPSGLLANPRRYANMEIVSEATRGSLKCDALTSQFLKRHDVGVAHRRLEKSEFAPPLSSVACRQGLTIPRDKRQASAKHGGCVGAAIRSSTSPRRRARRGSTVA